MIEMENELLDLFARLSRSATRSRLYAMRAQKDSRPELAQLYLALADSQAMQAQRFLMQVRGTVGPTDVNEQNTFTAEIPQMIEEYRTLQQEAEQLGSKALATGFRHSAEVERRNLELHRTMDDRPADTDYYVCDFCGYIATDAAPENCPVCTAPQKRFKAMDTAT